MRAVFATAGVAALFAVSPVRPAEANDFTDACAAGTVLDDAGCNCFDDKATDSGDRRALLAYWQSAMWNKSSPSSHPTNAEMSIATAAMAKYLRECMKK